MRYLFGLSSCGALSITHLLGEANTCKQPLFVSSLSSRLSVPPSNPPPPTRWESCTENHSHISWQSHPGASEQLLLTAAQLARSSPTPDVGIHRAKLETDERRGGGGVGRKERGRGGSQFYFFNSLPTYTRPRRHLHNGSVLILINT